MKKILLALIFGLLVSSPVLAEDIPAKTKVFARLMCITQEGVYSYIEYMERDASQEEFEQLVGDLELTSQCVWTQVPPLLYIIKKMENQPSMFYDVYLAEDEYSFQGYIFHKIPSEGI